MTGATEISEAFLESDQEFLAPVAEDLRAQVPAPAEPDLPKLEEESSHHRVLLLRTGAVIALSTLISIGGALLIHAVLAGVIVVGVWFPWVVPAGKGGRALAGLPEAGGSAGGFTILGDGLEDNAPPSAVAPNPGMAIPGPALASAALPPLPDVNSAQMATEISAPSVAPLPAQDLGNIRIAPATRAMVPASGQVAAPNPGALIGPSDKPGTPARGTGAGDGGGEEDRIFGLVKGDGSGGSGAGGMGSGVGSGRGNGIDRGLSAADREPQLLGFSGNSSNFTLPLKYEMKPPEKSVKLILAIAPDGTIAGATIDQSCGITEVDLLVRDYVLANFHFSPAYRAGKAIASEFPFEMSFKPFD